MMEKTHEADCGLNPQYELIQPQVGEKHVFTKVQETLL